MKRVFILAIIGILTISFIGCDINSKTQNTKPNQESEAVNKNTNEKNESSNENKSIDEKSVTLNENRVIDEKIALDDATDINIEIYAAKVSIKNYDGEEVKITGKLSEKSKGIDINKNGMEIGIIEKRDKSIVSIMDMEDKGSKFDILVPSKFKGNLIFKQGAGTAEIEGIKVKNINISGGAGELKCENIKFDKLNLDSGVGDYDLNLNEKCGDIEINGGVGKLNLKMEEVGGDLVYKGGVGDINITIPENSPVNFVTGKGVGSCKIDAKTSGEETYTFDLEVGVGSINIRN